MDDAGWVTAQHPAVSRLLNPKDCSDRALLLSGAYRDRMRRLTGLLDMALRAVVQRYFADARIRAIYALPPELEHILRLAAPRPYRVGWYRPDLVFDRDGTARICEIGARYPMNGWMVSRALSKGHTDFWDDLCALYPPGSTLALVHQREPSGEIDCLSDHVQRLGVGFLALQPQELDVRDGRLHARGRVLDHLILQLDRSELLAFTPEVLAHLVEHGDYFNDVRTVILVHDKRVLAVLSDAAIMRDAMPWDLYAELRPHLIPSTCVGSAAEAERFLQQDGDWIAKQSSGGRGIGSLVRSRCSADDWAELIRRDWPRLMFQPYVDQLDYVDADSGQPIHMVGMLLCRDAVCYGSGVFRGSDDAVINLHQQRGKLYPCKAVP
ncbi:hypothetical protein [Azospirillum sp.]|uniref:hypothetical protein n=1 Tax=Azospirillum sp. TaxID=34012 RepID=UPI002D33584C|nr:hypothetical protein [Azospirillum sp.]HYD68951.1 hypothetical protein [Azospirillum sp.]